MKETPSDHFTRRFFNNLNSVSTSPDKIMDIEPENEEGFIFPSDSDDIEMEKEKSELKTGFLPTNSTVNQKESVVTQQISYNPTKQSFSENQKITKPPSNKTIPQLCKYSFEYCSKDLKVDEFSVVDDPKD